ncbi:MAG: hypothetical protein ACPIOQ_28595, partial [Promethearchaeia archaeon]
PPDSVNFPSSNKLNFAFGWSSRVGADGVADRMRWSQRRAPLVALLATVHACMVGGSQSAGFRVPAAASGEGCEAARGPHPRALFQCGFCLAGPLGVPALLRATARRPLVAASCRAEATR